MSNIELDFQRDESIIKRGRETLSNVDDAIIEYSYFVMPITFICHEINIFNINKNEFLLLPLIHFATVGKSQIVKLEKSDSEIYDLPDIGGYLSFQRENNLIFVSSSLNKVRICVNYPELAEAFNKFSDKVSTFLKKEVPEIVSLKSWAKWFN